MRRFSLLSLLLLAKSQESTRPARTELVRRYTIREEVTRYPVKELVTEFTRLAPVQTPKINHVTQIVVPGHKEVVESEEHTEKVTVDKKKVVPQVVKSSDIYDNSKPEVHEVSKHSEQKSIESEDSSESTGEDSSTSQERRLAPTTQKAHSTTESETTNQNRKLRTSKKANTEHSTPGEESSNSKKADDSTTMMPSTNRVLIVGDSGNVMSDIEVTATTDDDMNNSKKSDSTDKITTTTAETTGEEQREAHHGYYGYGGYGGYPGYYGGYPGYYGGWGHHGHHRYEENITSTEGEMTTKPENESNKKLLHTTIEGEQSTESHKSNNRKLAPSTTDGELSTKSHSASSRKLAQTTTEGELSTGSHSASSRKLPQTTTEGELSMQSHSATGRKLAHTSTGSEHSTKPHHKHARKIAESTTEAEHSTGSHSGVERKLVPTTTEDEMSTRSNSDSGRKLVPTTTESEMNTNSHNVAAIYPSTYFVRHNETHTGQLAMDESLVADLLNHNIKISDYAEEIDNTDAMKQLNSLLYGIYYEEPLYTYALLDTYIPAISFRLHRYLGPNKVSTVGDMVSSMPMGDSTDYSQSELKNGNLLVADFGNGKTIAIQITKAETKEEIQQLLNKLKQFLNKEDFLDGATKIKDASNKLIQSDKVPTEAKSKISEIHNKFSGLIEKFNNSSTESAHISKAMDMSYEQSTPLVNDLDVFTTEQETNTGKLVSIKEKVEEALKRTKDDMKDALDTIEKYLKSDKSLESSHSQKIADLKKKLDARI